MTAALTVAVVGIAAFALTPVARRVALSVGLVDTPNERSMHQGQVARGAGVAFVGPFLVAVAWMGRTGALPGRLVFGLLVGGGVVGLVGLSDDLRPKPPLLRLVLWAGPLLAVLASYDWMPTVDLGFTRLRWGVLGGVVAALGGVWLTTLYNFMDGIDGLAAGQAVVTAGGAAALLALDGHAAEATVSAALAAGALGFLVWNWRGGVFMGDVGANFLGATFAVLGLHTESVGALPVLVWLILLMPFLVDATFTLIRRLGGGRPWGRAHREHAYQRATLAGRSHTRVTAAILAFDGVLIAVAALSRARPEWLAACAVGAFAATALIWAVVRSRAASTHTPG